MTTGRVVTLTLTEHTTLVQQVEMLERQLRQAHEAERTLYAALQLERERAETVAGALCPACARELASGAA